MINKRRVQRIKNIIYIFIVVMFFLPLILMIALCIKMMGVLDDVTYTLDKVVTRIEENPSYGDEPDDSLQPSTIQPQSRSGGASSMDMSIPASSRQDNEMSQPVDSSGGSDISQQDTLKQNDSSGGSLSPINPASVITPENSAQSSVPEGRGTNTDGGASRLSGTGANTGGGQPQNTVAGGQSGDDHPLNPSTGK